MRLNSNQGRRPNRTARFGLGFGNVLHNYTKQTGHLHCLGWVEDGAHEVPRADLHAVDIAAAQVGLRECGAPHIGPGEVAIAELGTRKVRSFE